MAGLPLPHQLRESNNTCTTSCSRYLSYMISLCLIHLPLMCMTRNSSLYCGLGVRSNACSRPGTSTALTLLANPGLSYRVVKALMLAYCSTKVCTGARFSGLLWAQYSILEVLPSSAEPSPCPHPPKAPPRLPRMLTLTAHRVWLPGCSIGRGNMAEGSLDTECAHTQPPPNPRLYETCDC